MFFFFCFVLFWFGFFSLWRIWIYLYRYLPLTSFDIKLNFKLNYPLSSCTWIRKSPFRWPVVTTTKIASDHCLEQHSKQGSYWIQRFYPQLLWYNWPAKLQVRSEERRLYSQAYNSNSNAWHWRSTKGRWDAMKKLIGLSLWKLSGDKWRKILTWILGTYKNIKPLKLQALVSLVSWRHPASVRKEERYNICGLKGAKFNSWSKEEAVLMFLI